jgi:hypothetical protein
MEKMRQDSLYKRFKGGGVESKDTLLPNLNNGDATDPVAQSDLTTNSKTRMNDYDQLIVSLASYPLFSLDEIGAELQNPFSPRNLSHLPLDVICKNIAANVMGLLKI